MKKAPEHLVFFSCDSLGIPLEMVIERVTSRLGITTQHAIGNFVEGARKAGWKESKIKADLRELDLFIPLPDPVRNYVEEA